MFICDLCGNYKTHLKELLYQHMQVKHVQPTDISKVTCTVCLKVFKGPRAKNNHMRRVHLGLKGIFACDMCEKTYENKSSLAAHKDNVHVHGNFGCNDCEMVFHRRQDLYNHKGSVHKNKRKCEVCGKSYKIGSTFNNHMKNSHGRETIQYKCNECPKVYNFKPSLRYHIEHEHPKDLNPEPQNHPCALCTSVFPTKDKLRNHRTRSHSNKTFSCEICDYTSVRRDYIKQHLRKHTSDENYTRQIMKRLKPKRNE